MSYVSLSSKKYPCDAIIFSHTPSQSLASCVAAHAFIVPGINLTNYFPVLFLCLRQEIFQHFWSYQHRGVALQKLVPAHCGDPFQLQHAAGWRSLQSAKSHADKLKPQDYLSGLTQQPYSASLLHPDVLRTFVCHDVTQFCFPLSQGGQGVSTFSPWRFSEAASHKLYLCPKLSSK